MRHYEVMIILDPTLDERTVAPSLEGFLDVIRKSGGDVEKVDIWGRRRLSYEINKHAEGIYALVDVNAEPDAVKELDRQLSLTENVLRTKVLRRNEQRAKGAAAAAKSLAARNARTSKSAASAMAAAASAPKAD